MRPARGAARFFAALRASAHCAQDDSGGGKGLAGAADGHFCVWQRGCEILRCAQDDRMEGRRFPADVRRATRSFAALRMTVVEQRDDRAVLLVAPWPTWVH